MKQFIFLLALVFLPFCGFSQSTEKLLTLANEANEEGLYQTAFNYYTKAFRQMKKADIAYLCAETARQANNYERALQWYNTYLSLPSQQENPLTYFHKAQMLRNLEMLTSAIDTFNIFLQQENINDSYKNKALHEIEACRWALNQDTNAVLIEHFSNRINTKNSESCAVAYSDSLLLFVSMRAFASSSASENLIDELVLSNLYESRMDKKGKYSIASLSKWKLNSKHDHLTSFCFDRLNKRIYLSYCMAEGYKMGTCELYFSDLKNNQWTKPKKMPTEINVQGYSSMQPAVAYEDGKVILYFCSNRPNGMGGYDIWYSLVDGEKCSPAINLGSPVNTPGNEITPFYYQDSTMLYFSSDEHFGFGGYDVFSAKGHRNTWQQPKNLRKPINSAANDFFYNVKFDNSQSGFVTSNRKGSYHIENETCCNDIYGWKTIIPAAFDSIPPDSLWRKALSEKPKKDKRDEIRQLLPLSLYFHNDEPDPKTVKTTTTETYFQTLAKYKAKKALYLKAFENDPNKEEKQKAVILFFQNKVDSSFNYLTHFLDLLLEDLSNGHKIVLTVKGYASPLYIDTYNEKLSKRRISSLINELLAYKNGEITPFLNSEDASLEIVELALGSSTADSLVGRNAKDLNSSVYSVTASKERRVDILGYAYKEEKDDIAPKTSNNSILQIENSMFTLGEIPAQKKVFFEIPLKNNSSEPQEIESIDLGCTCVKVHYNKNIEPQKNIILTLEIDGSKAKRGQTILVPLSIKLKSENTTQTIFIEYSVE